MERHGSKGTGRGFGRGGRRPQLHRQRLRASCAPLSGYTQFSNGAGISGYSAISTFPVLDVVSSSGPDSGNLETDETCLDFAEAGVGNIVESVPLFAPLLSTLFTHPLPKGFEIPRHANCETERCQGMRKLDFDLMTLSPSPSNVLERISEEDEASQTTTPPKMSPRSQMALRESLREIQHLYSRDWASYAVSAEDKYSAYLTPRSENSRCIWQKLESLEQQMSKVEAKIQAHDQLLSTFRSHEEMVRQEFTQSFSAALDSQAKAVERELAELQVIRGLILASTGGPIREYSTRVDSLLVAQECNTLVEQHRKLKEELLDNLKQINARTSSQIARIVDIDKAGKTSKADDVKSLVLPSSTGNDARRGPIHNVRHVNLQSMREGPLSRKTGLRKAPAMTPMTSEHGEYGEFRKRTWIDALAFSEDTSIETACQSTWSCCTSEQDATAHFPLVRVSPEGST